MADADDGASVCRGILAAGGAGRRRAPPRPRCDQSPFSTSAEALNASPASTEAAVTDP